MGLENKHLTDLNVTTLKPNLLIWLAIILNILDDKFETSLAILIKINY